MVSLARNARTGDTAEKHRLLNHQNMPQFHRYDMDTKIDLSKLIFWGETIITWIVISAIFTALGLVIGWLFSQLIFCARMVITDLIGAMLFGPVVGAFVGFGQHSRMNARINLPHR